MNKHLKKSNINIFLHKIIRYNSKIRVEQTHAFNLREKKMKEF